MRASSPAQYGRAAIEALTDAALRCDEQHIATCVESSGRAQAGHTLQARRKVMCLGVPGQILEIKDKVATVDFWGTKTLVRLDELERPAALGDYIIDHAGWAVRVIPIEDVPDTLALYEVLLSEAGEDPIARDAAAELEGILCESRS